HLAGFIVLPFLALAAPAGSDDVAGKEILNKYLEATHTQQEVLRGGEMEVNLQAKLPRLAQQGTLQALYRISKLGKITYKALGFSGDNTVKKEVIARYMDEESKPHDSSLAITPENYKFKYRGLALREGQRVYVFQLTPKKKVVGLFHGELWLD